MRVLRSSCLRALLCMVVLMVWTSAASAAIVSFTTAGTFSNATNSITSTGGAYTLTYTNRTGPNLNVPEGSTQNADFGRFTLSVTGTPPINDSFAPQLFTMQITQTQPTAGGPTPLVANISGTLSVVPGTPPAGGGSVAVLFTPLSSLTLGAVTYAISPNPFVLDPPIPGGDTFTDVRGTVTVVPLPPAVWAGLSLMGLMGIKGYRRQRLIKAGE